jgi:hypothetical protein
VTRLERALQYAGLGWAVLPLYSLSAGACTCGDAACRSPGKHPHRELVPHGVHDATLDAARIRDWWTRVPGANVGIAMGAASGIDALDVDPRNGGDDTLAQAERSFGRLPDTAIQLTGGGGYHYLFRHDPQRRLRSPGRGVDVKGTGGYIVAEPSSHATGGTYAWEGSADPTEGHPIAAAPAWLAPEAAAPNTSTAAQVEAVGHLPPGRIADLRAALAHIDPSSYAQWIAVGQALHSTQAPEAFELWDTWSQGATNYDATTAIKWRTFNAGGALHVESIFAWARDAGWDGTTPAQPTAAPVKPFVPPPAAAPEPLLQLPGALGTFVDLYNRTAPKPQPQFAVQAALAFACVVLGRRYRTARDNWPGLYLVNVAKSAAGKEHARTVIDATLSAAGLAHLLGPSGYTSDSAVFSALHHQPCHLTVIDELGELLGNAKAQGNYHKRQAITALVQAWGLLHGTLRPQGYSTMALQAAQRQEAATRCVHRPALSMLAMTTPRTFYDSLTEQSIEGGFLNRLLIVESQIGRQLARDVDPLEVPDSLVEWCRAAREGQGGNLAGFDLAADQVPVPRVVEFTPAARAAFRAYEAECMAAMDRLDPEGLAELEGRSAEKAMRIALLLAVADNVTTPFIQPEHAEWAIAYVRHYTAQTIEAVRRYLNGSQFGQWRQAVLDALRRAGERGLTDRELARNSRVYAGLEPRMRDSLTRSLRDDGLIELKDLGAGPSGRGRKRVAWLALADAEDSDGQ